MNAVTDLSTPENLLHMTNTIVHEKWGVAGKITKKFMNSLLQKRTELEP